MNYFKPENTVKLASGCVIVGTAPETRGKVAFIAEHGPDGTVAFRLDQPLKSYTLSQVVAQVKPEVDSDVRLYQGGETQMDTLHMLHNADYGGTLIGPVMWGGTYSTLLDKLNSGDYDASKLRLFVGYSDWEPGELEKEVKDGLWACVAASERVILSGKNPWKFLVKKLGPFGQLVLNTPAPRDIKIPAYQLN